MKEYFLSREFYEVMTIFAILTITYVVLKRVAPKLTDRLSEKLKLDTKIVGELKTNVISFLNVLYVIFLLNWFLSIPILIEYVKPIMGFQLLNTETLKISFSSVIKAVIVFYILLLMTKIIRKTIQAYLFYRSEGADVVSTIDILIYNVALVVIILTSLSIVGISWKLLLPIAGALGIGLGFGLQDIANNFISGFVILMAKTVKRGDWITLGDNFGKIDDIGIRTSTLRTIDNIDIIIPNSHLVSNQLINWSYSDNIVRVHIPVGVSYSSDVNLVRETILEVAKKSPDILNTHPIEARFLEFGDSSLNFELLGWIDIKKTPIQKIKSVINYLIWDAFKEKEIQIPFPQRDVWFRNELKMNKDSET